MTVIGFVGFALLIVLAILIKLKMPEWKGKYSEINICRDGKGHERDEIGKYVRLWKIGRARSRPSRPPGTYLLKGLRKVQPSFHREQP